MNDRGTYREVRIGLLAGPLWEQLDLPREALEKEERVARALVLCRENGIITDADSERAYPRLLKLISEAVKAYRVTTPVA